MEEISIAQGIGKQATYQQLLQQIEALIGDEPDLTANLANTVAALHHTFKFWWTGFYLVQNNQLVLAPFQGPVACTRINFGKGVCGTAWQQKQTLIVPDVEKFEGHIACSSATQSEIVVPIIVGGEVLAVLDVDSEHLNNFDETDKTYLEQIGAMVAAKF